MLSPALITGCTGQEMDNQPYYETFEEAPDFPTGASARALPEGVVARGSWPPPERPEMTLALVERGRERYGIFCSPCHGGAGDGRGMIVQRGFPQPPSYHTGRLRRMPDAHFYDVITEGYGVMYAYATRVPPEDRWAIVAYIRALQLARYAEVGDLPGDVNPAAFGPAADEAADEAEGEADATD